MLEVRGLNFKRRLGMPFVNIRITKEKGEPTKEQKAQLIEGVTNLLSEVLGPIIMAFLPFRAWIFGIARSISCKF